MPITTRNLLDQYTEILQKIYGKHLKKVILYGSYARGDYRDDSKPIAKSQQHFQNWVDAYPFYANVEKEGVKLFEAA